MTNDTSARSNAKVRLYGLLNSAEAYEIRDFLNRSVVEFDWIELTTDEDCDRELGFSCLSDLRLPIIQFPDGTQLFSPSVKFGIELLLLREGIKAEFKNDRIYVDLADGSKMIARANICATGVEYRRLNVPNEDRFLNLGVFYGAGASEAPMCRDEHIFVVGGGNSAGQAALHFSRYAKQVTMVIRGSNLAATLSQYLIHRITTTPNIEVRFNAQVIRLDGDATLRSITITDEQNGTTQQIDTRRLFVCIGGVPNTDWAKDTSIVRDDAGYLITGSDLLKAGCPPECWTRDRDPFFLESSIPGSFAAGDVRHGSIKRVASAVGEGAMAVTFVHKYLEENG